MRSLPIDSKQIAAIINNTSVEQRQALYALIAQELHLLGQGYSAGLFDVIATMDKESIESTQLTTSYSGI